MTDADGAAGDDGTRARGARRTTGGRPALGHSARSDPLRSSSEPNDRLGELRAAVADLKYDVRMLKVSIDKQTMLLERLLHRVDGRD